jgi:hypothetical protein
LILQLQSYGAGTSFSFVVVRPRTGGPENSPGPAISPAAAEGRINRDLPFDPNCYFVGDEVATSVRAFTAGYDVYHPQIVLGWHCYDRASRGTHWTDHPTWEREQTRSMHDLQRLYEGRRRGRHGVGPRRSVESYRDRLPFDILKERGQ